MKIDRWIVLLSLVVLIAMFSVSATDPPSLTDFHQFYGEVTGLANGTYMLKAKIGTQEYTTPIQSDGQFGLTSAFKVYSSSGGTIKFYVSDGVADLEVGEALYKAKDTTELTFDYTPKVEIKTETTTETTTDITPYTQDITTPVQETQDIPTASVPAQVCTPFEKRCFGNNLEVCAVDGSFWTTKESCNTGCDPISFVCKQEPQKEKSSLPLLLIIGVIFLALAIIGGLAYYFLKIRGSSGGSEDEGANEQIKSYIQKARSQGENDADIRVQMMQQGWDEDEINALLRK